MLTIGLPIDDDGQDGPPSLEQQELDPLAEAPRHAADVAKALARFGYRPPSAGGDAPSSAEAGGGDPSGRIRAAITMPDDDTAVLVVHLVAHGRIAASGERTLHAVGRDGRNCPAPRTARRAAAASGPRACAGG
ncbi:hypothetical protein [Streptomyces sp. NPDC056160]|uniref:hypothetical protein n=1 Tax=Streptomyces sp. NPDC056160 TaxID=3345731 RepID=UPI0035DE1016